ncbi:MAG: S8 family serine peptidase [Opitutales bacterium]|nr:S8 family serine peptidase [Opitutales bacterium]
MKKATTRLSKNFLFVAALASSAICADAATPTSVYSDPLVSQQWQWDPNRNGVNIADVWASGITGRNIVIGIIDQWVEPFHEDLNVSTYNTATSWAQADLSQGLSYDFINPGQSPGRDDAQIYQGREHGTACAGLAAAVGGNGVGLVGAAPGATIAGLNASYENTPGITVWSRHFLWASGITNSYTYSGEALIDVKSNSYGSTANSSSDGEADRGITFSSANNVIYCFAAGNSRQDRDEVSNTAFSSFLNDRRVITVAACGGNSATGGEDIFSGFSSYGSNVFVASPGTRVVGTDRTGVIGYDMTSNYCTWDGTSAATPIVSGVMALGKEVFKDMDVRWAKHAIAWSSGHNENPNINANDSSGTGSWQKNNGGYWFNNNYGFGKIDAVGFVDATRNILYTTTEKSLVVNNGFTAGTLSNEGVKRTINFTFTPTSDLLQRNLEAVSVRLNFSQAAFQTMNFAKLKLTLTAPDGKSSVLAEPNATDPALRASIDFYTFLTNAFWGSNYDNSGEWTLRAEYEAGSADQNTTGWVTMNQVEFTTGSFVFESADNAVAAGTTLEAHAIAIDGAETNFDIAGTVLLEDSVFVNAGTLTLAPTGSIAAYTEGILGDKGVKYQQSGGNVSFAGTGNFKRGFKQTGGTFTLSGTLNANAGITVSGSGKFVVSGATATINNTMTVSGSNTSLTVENGGLLNYRSGTLTINSSSSLIFKTDTVATSSINVAGGSIVVTDNVKLIVNLSISTLDVSAFEIAVITAANLANINLTESNVTIRGTDGTYNGAFEFFKENGEVKLGILGQGELIETIDESKEIGEGGARYKSTLTRFEGTLTGDGILTVNHDLAFAANASAYSGETRILANCTYTIEETAQLGTGTFNIAEKGKLVFSGTQTVSNTISGDGTLSVTGTLTYSGDAGALNGKVEISGTGNKIITASGSTLKTLSLKNNATAEIGGSLTGDLSASGANAELLATGTLGGKIDLDNATLTTAGTLTLGAANETNLRNNSRIVGDVIVGATVLTVRRSTIDGDLTVSDDASVVHLSEANITGDFTATTGTINISNDNVIDGTITIQDNVVVNQAANATLSGGSMNVDNAEYDVAGDVNVANLIIENNATLNQDSGNILNLVLRNNATAMLAGTVSGTISVDSTSTLNATAGTFTGTSVTNNGMLHLYAGTLLRSISGTGTTILDEDVSTDAGNIGMTFQNNASLTLTGGTLSNTVNGSGNIVVDGAVSGNADYFCNPVTNNATLTLTGGTVTMGIDGDGTTVIDGNVTSDADLLGTVVTVTAGNALTVSGGSIDNEINGAGTTILTGSVNVNADLLKTAVTNNGNMLVNSGTLNTPVMGTGTITVSNALKTDASYLGVPVINNQRLTLTGGSLSQCITGTGTTSIEGNVSVAVNSAFGSNKITINHGQLNINSGVSVNNNVTLLLSNDYRLGLASTPIAALTGNGNFSGTVTISAINSRYVTRLSDYTSLSFLLADAGTQVAADLNSVTFSIDSAIWPEWSVADYSAGILTLAYRYDPTPYTAPSNLKGLYGLVNGTTILGYQKSTFNARLVALSPIAYGSLIEMQSGCAAIVNDLLRERLEQRRYELGGLPQNTTGTTFYANAFSQMRDSDGDGSKSANYDIDHMGIVAGVDAHLGRDTLFGFGVAADFATAQTKDGKKNNADTVMISFSGMQVFENTYIGFGLSAGSSSIKARRNFDAEDFSQKTNGNNVNFSLIAGAGWVLSDVARIDISPFVGMDLGYARVNGFNESSSVVGGGSSSVALNVDSYEHFSLRGKVGTSLNWRATPKLRLGLEFTFAHEFIKPELDIDARFGQNATLGSQKFTSTAYLMDENSFQAGPRIDYSLNKNWSLSAAYTYESDFKDVAGHSGNVGVRCRF